MWSFLCDTLFRQILEYKLIIIKEVILPDVGALSLMYERNSWTAISVDANDYKYDIVMILYL